MNTQDISLLLKKADELRSLFVLGQRVIPFLEEIFVFVQDIQPMLEEINNSIDENIKKMPGASEKLSKVTEANELATTEIMDTLDKMFGSTDKLNKNSSDISNHYKKIIDKPLRLLEILRRGIDSGGDLKKALPQIDSAISKIKSFNANKIKPLEDENKSIVDEINNDAGAIMMSLQVQDITSQQIAAVDHMLVAVQDKLADILKHFKNTDVSSLVDLDKPIDADDDPMKTNTSKLHREIAFDPNAIGSYEDNQKRQDMVDSLVDGSVSPDDIKDDLEEDKSSPAKAKTTDTPATREEPEEELSQEPQSQDDIDALFGGGIEVDEEEDAEKSSEESDAEDLNVSQDQDDIDKMFSEVKDEEVEEKADEPTTEEKESSEESDKNKKEEEDFDFSKFEDLGDNPDQNDIDALFNG